MKAKSYIDKGYVRVIFRMFHGEVIALFPDLPADNRPEHCTCYAHVGQHSAANLAHVMRNSKPCTFEQRRALKDELIGAPYNYKLVERQRFVRLNQTRKGQN